LLAVSRAEQNSSSGATGLLFGKVESDFVSVQAFRPLPAVPNPKERLGTNAAAQDWYQMTVARPKDDLELVGLTLVGWYSTRNAGGLQADDLQFHQKSFGKSTDLALIAYRNEEGEFTLELYSGNVDGTLSIEGHRWGSVRIPATETVDGPVEVSLRSKIQDELYMRAYRMGEEEEESSSGRWKEALSNTRKLLGF